ncbi:unnamed protein product [Durusdinium trenchii]|uniref:Uncharacterized protein n=1 Tax=Durusdinium trenchii TaxID=1381693 RepID=A0ABP0PHL2_9DINO
MSAALKEEGNRKFKEGDFSGAVEAYSQSLEHDPEQHLCYSNRSAAYLKLGMFEKALLDAESCTKMAPEFPKGYSRQAAALQELKRWEEAFAILEQGTTKCSQDDAAALQKTSHEAKDRWLICQLQGCWHGKVTEALGGYEQEIEFLNSREVRVQVLGRSIMGRFWVDASQSPMHLDIQVVMEDIPVTMPPPPPVPYITKVDDEGLHLCCPYMKLERPETFGGEGYCKMAKGTLDNSQDASVQQLSKAEQLLLCAKEVIKALPSERPPEIDAMDNEEAQQQKVMAQVKFETAIFKVQNRFGEELMKEVFEAAKGEAPEGLRGTAELEELRSKLQIIESTPEPEPDPVAERAARRARRKAPVPEAEGDLDEDGKEGPRLNKDVTKRPTASQVLGYQWFENALTPSRKMRGRNNWATVGITKSFLARPSVAGDQANPAAKALRELQRSLGAEGAKIPGRQS